MVGLALVGVSVLHKRNFADGSYLLGVARGVQCSFLYDAGLKQQMQTCLQGKFGQTACKIFILRYVDQLV